MICGAKEKVAPGRRSQASAVLHFCHAAEAGCICLRLTVLVQSCLDTLRLTVIAGKPVQNKTA